MPPKNTQPPATRPTVGIITGSGPEAGIDLWSKILRKNMAAFGDDFRGDLDAPRVVVVSEPKLGLSMDLDRNDAAVWASMQRAVAVLAPQVDAFAIACNTLNWYAPRIEALRLPARLISFQSVLKDWIRAAGVRRVALLAAAPITEMRERSAYRFLPDLVDVEIPQDSLALHELIHDVKRFGSDAAALRCRFAELVQKLQSDDVLLACTELPLISNIPTSKRLIDVTDLVAATLVQHSLGEPIK